MKLREIAEMLGGELAGGPDIEIKGAAGISDAKDGDITFLSTAKLISECIESKASAVIVKETVPEIKKPQLKVSNPQYAFARLLEHFYVKQFIASGISEGAYVSAKAKIDKDVSIFPMAFIADDAAVGSRTVIYPGVFIGKDSSVGDECIIYPNVTIRENVKIGSRAIIHSGAVIGSDGFGYVMEKGIHYKIPQIGGVIIGDDVEIGANVTIDRATTGNTIIGRGTKIDNLVHIAHNVKIGENSVIAAQTGVAGSTEIGNYVVFGGQVGVADHAKIDDGVMVGAQSGAMGHVTKGIYSGSPMIPHRDWLKSMVIFAKLPELSKRIKELEDMIKNIERREQR
ncbi:MAG: UDP-3-O-(3-hydroxymyristoyl)glucosamine N-acyltransferase [Nitrospirae bacterium GWF2_44_13]|nr:MAG: UDP-3-O-(3-hydroxymyristoyl)glucosamine N-acyltransferase [Nitrospirae bacterium GWF2_44_13]OGW34499.1 MAG: UDP-3-O-(3-hydroxymyristoyl)glucosamine N-acyltransferase [Nitrospirae bacterium GWD2_44_7]OGW66199.1 MAG: UDP-3-O-(3-hydroxymyristoyl)glucosamine N-acyltransferase [Nitrospirae bacterium RIFOXYA2_FULL_44_9]HBG93680.1 UDP-3-O-(3-hydroxymyristoyl)glucosamine N-acyltransferase [Nitrospiraceae bacterium]